MSNVEHTFKMNNVSASSGMLEADPMTLVKADARIIAALVYLNCESGKINTWTSEIVKQVGQVGEDTLIRLNCWDLTECEEAEEVDCYWIDDPCVRARMLKECLAKWAFVGKEKGFSWRDRSKETSFITEAKLCQLIDEAQSECDRRCGINNRCVTFKCGMRC